VEVYVGCFFTSPDPEDPSLVVEEVAGLLEPELGFCWEADEVLDFKS
jgi:hypothetical protein